MDQVKVGKFIAEQRKLHNLTQEQLASKLDVDRTLISKWERAVSLPDISLLEPLCKILDISLSELLNGQSQEHNLKTGVKAEVEAIKYYNSSFKSKLIKRGAIMLTLITLIFVVALFSFKVNEYKIYEIHSDNKDFILDGYFMVNKFRKIVIINNLVYNEKYIGTSKELLINNVDVSLVSNDNNVYNYRSDGCNDPKSINEFLKNINIELDTENENVEIDENNLSLRIKYIINNELKVFDFKLKFERK